MKSCVNTYYTVFAFVKNSPYSRYVNDELGRYIDSGIVDYWFRLMTIKRGKSYMRALFDEDEHHAEKTEPKPLQISNVIGAFYLLGVGLSLSTIVFTFEIYVHKRRIRNLL